MCLNLLPLSYKRNLCFYVYFILVPVSKTKSHPPPKIPERPTPSTVRTPTFIIEIKTKRSNHANSAFLTENPSSGTLYSLSHFPYVVQVQCEQISSVTIIFRGSSVCNIMD